MIGLTRIASGLVSIMQGIPPGAKHAVDATSLVAVMMSWFSFAQASLTIISTIAGLIWIGIRIWETETIKEWNRKRKEQKGTE